MRVLHVYSGNLYGGVERMLVAMAKSGRFGEHAFALCFEGRLSQELRDVGAAVRMLPEARLRSPVSVLRLRSALGRTLNEGAYERVVCHGVWSYCMAAAVIRRHGLSPVLFLHDVPQKSKLLYRWAWLRPPALCIANSAFVQRQIAELPGSVKTAVVHPLVPQPDSPAIERVHAVRQDHGAHDEIVILQASRLDSWKGHRTLLRALAKLKDLPGWRAWIAGAAQRSEETRYASELASLTLSLGLGDRVRFIGHQSDMPVVLAACDIYCQPNEQPEPFGMVFVEALGLGKPVVAGDSGGVREIVKQDCGILCPSDPGAVALALQKLIADAALRERLGAAGRERAASLCGLEAFARSLDAALA